MRPFVCADTEMYANTDSRTDANGYAIRILAEGDSWFSMGNLAAVNLLTQQDFDRSAIIVNCACPGDSVASMVQYMVTERFYDALRYRDWTAIYLSGGGNDLIDAINGADGTRRILKQAANPASLVAGDWINAAELKALVDYVRVNLAQMISWRSGVNARTPVLLNTYDYAVPGPDGLLVAGPWMYPRLVELGAPQALWAPVARHLIQALANAIWRLHKPATGVYVARTAGTLTPPLAGAPGGNVDWANEIHPTEAGYDKLCTVWKQKRRDWRLTF